MIENNGGRIAISNGDTYENFVFDQLNTVQANEKVSYLVDAHGEVLDHILVFRHGQENAFLESSLGCVFSQQGEVIEDDIAVYNTECQRALHIECKYQNSRGSNDEKITCAGYRYYQFWTADRQVGYDSKLIYVANSHFFEERIAPRVDFVEKYGDGAIKLALIQQAYQTVSDPVQCNNMIGRILQDQTFGIAFHQDCLPAEQLAWVLGVDL